MAPYSLYSALHLTRSLWNLVQSNALHRESGCRLGRNRVRPELTSDPSVSSVTGGDEAERRDRAPQAEEAHIPRRERGEPEVRD